MASNVRSTVQLKGFMITQEVSFKDLSVESRRKIKKIVWQVAALMLSYPAALIFSIAMGWDHVAAAIFFPLPIAFAITCFAMTWSIVKETNAGISGAITGMFSIGLGLFGIVIAFSSHDVVTQPWGALVPQLFPSDTRFPSVSGKTSMASSLPRI